MVFACCFGGGAQEERAVVNTRSQAYTAPGDLNGKTVKADFSEVPSGATNKTAATFQSGNTTSLSAVTTADNSSPTYQLQILSSALAGLTGNWYERVASAAARLTTASGAALCSVSMLDSAHERFTVVYVTGKDAEASAMAPTGSQLPALQSVAPSAHLSTANAGAGLRYNSVQVLQLLQTPLMYSFSDPAQGSRETSQPPHDWQAIHESHGFSDFCALPLSHEKSVVGAVTLAFKQSTAGNRPNAQQQQGAGQAPRTVGAGAPPATSPLMSCDEQALRTLGLLLSVLLVGQDLNLAQQVADILSGIHEARNLQQVVTVVTAGAEQMLQLTTRMLVTINLAMLTMSNTAAAAGPSSAAAGVSNTGASAAGGATAPSSSAANASAPGAGGGGNTAGAGAASGGVASSSASGRAIFFEERSTGGTGSRVEGSAQTAGTNGSRSMASAGDPHGSGSGVTRSRLQRGNAGADGQSLANTSNSSQPPNLVSPRLRVCTSGGSTPAPPPGLRITGAAASLSHEGASGAPSGSQGGLFWQAGLVQARALGLRHTLLANLPSNGTIVHDCASYMQQVGCPKRDLYLLSTCQGAPPFSLVIVPAPLKDGDPTQLVLYVAVPMRLPMELLNEIQMQTQLLAMRVLAPMLRQKLLYGNLSEEWTILLGCAAGKATPTTGSAAAAAAAASGNPNASGGAAANSGTISNQGQRVSGSALGGGGGRGNVGGKDSSGDAGATVAAAAAAGLATGSSGDGSGQQQGKGSRQAGDAGASTEGSRGGTGGTGPPPSPQGPQASGRVLAPSALAVHTSSMTVLSTTMGGAFAGDTRTHMGMLVASFKDTINALQATRAEEAEELTVLKLGKVLGRGGSGLVFQGYLHLGLEVAVKLFENPDDTDPEAVSPDDPQAAAAQMSTNADGSSTGPEAALAAAAAAAEASPHGTAKDGAAAAAAAAADKGEGKEKDAKEAKETKESKDKDKEGASKDGRRNSSKAAAQMTKRQRDLLRNALELGVTSSLSHPNIVQGYCHWVNVVLMQDASLNRCWLMGQAEYMALAPPGSPPPPLCSALVMEYCDMGSLIHALKRGTFTTPEAKPNMEYIYMCLLEIALALRHLHTAKLAHCDLKPGNVLLRSSPRDQRGFVCKLGDFGYAAILKDGLLPGRPAVLPDEACGTLQYMAPELFVAGRPVDASIDIYAFGMLMWELITGKTPYSDTEYGSRALMKAVYHGKRPAFPESTLQAYKNLAMCCWSGDPNLRPSASVLVKLLRQQLESLKQQSQSTSSGSGASGGVRV